MESIIKDIKYRTFAPLSDIHFHHAYEIIYIKSGKVLIKINNTEYTVNENSVVVISNLEEHSTQLLSGNYSRFFIILDSEKTDKAIPYPELISIFKNRPPHFCHVFEMGDKKALTEHIFDELYNSFNDKMQYKGEYQSALITQLLISMYNLPDRKTVQIKPARPEIFAVQKYIEQNFTKNLLVSEIADKFFIDHCYLTHSFKETTGFSPKEYIILNRLSYAKRLLLQSELSVLEISEKCGFSDVNNFIRYFKREFSVTPKRYRTQNNI